LIGAELQHLPVPWESFTSAEELTRTLDDMVNDDLFNML
jgi:hypothetical protein